MEVCCFCLLLAWKLWHCWRLWRGYIQVPAIVILVCFILMPFCSAFNILHSSSLSRLRLWRMEVCPWEGTFSQAKLCILLLYILHSFTFPTCMEEISGEVSCGEHILPLASSAISFYCPLHFHRLKPVFWREEERLLREAVCTTHFLYL